MNDPHVEALVYRIRHDETFDYTEAKPLDFETQGFRIKAEDETVRFQMKEHFAAEQQAREVVDPFARNWEFDVCLQRGPGCFELEFDRAEIIDRRPTPGVIEVSSGPVRWEISVSTPSVTVGLSAYPSPPTDIDTSDPDVQTLWERYRRYREGREELPSFAYFCLTVLVHWAEKTQGKCKAGSRLQLAAATCFVEKKVLRRIAELSSTRGGSRARKSDGLSKPLTPDETRFLEDATTRLIGRVAERSAGQGNLPPISMSDFHGP